MLSAFFLSLLLNIPVITGSEGKATVTVRQLHVTGYESFSAVLSVSYNLSKPLAWLQIIWYKNHSSTPVGICTIHPSKGEPKIKHFPEGGYEQRMHINPKDGSLRINHLRSNDSGIYRVVIRDKQLSDFKTINLTVIGLGEGQLPTNTDNLDSEIPDGQDEYHFWNVLEEDDNNTFSNESSQSLKSGHCICSDISTNMDLSTSAWIFLGSRIACALLSLGFITGLHLYLTKRKGRKKKKIITPGRRY